MKNRWILSPFFLDETLPELEALAGADWLVNKPRLPENNKLDNMTAIHQTLAEAVHRAVTNNERPVSVAGDCCTAIAVLAGLQRAGIDPTLIWLDAHGDFNTPETSPSGFLGGMPLAMIVGKGDQTFLEAVGLRALPEKQVILTDGRDLDPGERDLIRASAVTHLPDAASLLDHPLPGGPLYVHFDTDIVSAAESPAQNYLAPGGPASKVIDAVFKRISQSGNLAAVSMSTWNPTLDTDKKSETVSMTLLRTLTGTSS